MIYQNLKGMEKSFLIIILFLNIHLHSNAQALGKPGATWIYLHHSFWDGPVPAKHKYLGQVKIDSFIYDDVFHSSGYHFYFTERNKKLFFISSNQKERLLIDKNAVIGDFWFIEPPTPASPSLFPFLVEVIDTGTILINGISLKKWDLRYIHWDPNTTEEFFDTFVERIGSINRFIDPYDEFFENGADAGIGGELICYSDDEIYYERQSGTCSALLSNKNISYEKPHLYWDNHSNQLHIERMYGVVQIVIYDFLGRQILAHNLNGENFKFNLPFSGGLVLFIYNNGFMQSLKFF